MIETAAISPETQALVLLSVYHRRGMGNWSKGNEEYNTAQKHRLQSLLRYRDCGVDFLEIRKKLRPANKKNPIKTDMGVYNSFEQFLDINHGKLRDGSNISNLSKSQVKKYMRLAENWSVIETLNLTEHSACFRLEVTLKIITWALEKEEKGILMHTLTHKQYFEELRQGKLANKPEQPDYSNYNIKDLLREIREKDAIIARLSDRVQELESNRPARQPFLTYSQKYRVTT